MIQTAGALGPTQLFSLNCLLRDDDPDRMFTVEISKNKNVSILKDRIKEKKAHHLNHIDASDLDLWEVSFPIDNFPSANLTNGPKLRAGELLSDAFPSELDLKYIHVIVDVPVRSEYYMDS